MRMESGDMDGLNERVVARLAERRFKISSAESCTGGLFAAFITEVSGSSEVFEESIITYSNEAKMRELGVRKTTLERVGAVSRETAYEMARGICRRTGADIGVGITGIAGPTGGTAQKPVGTVYVALNICGGISVYHLRVKGNRSEVRRETCRFAFQKLIEKI